MVDFYGKCRQIYRSSHGSVMGKDLFFFGTTMKKGTAKKVTWHIAAKLSDHFLPNLILPAEWWDFIYLLFWEEISSEKNMIAGR